MWKENFMHFHVRIHHWVLWWFYVGVICGAIAVVSILARDLTRIEERVILVIGVLFWLQGGLVCYAYDSIQIEKPHQESPRGEPPSVEEPREKHSASDFLLPRGPEESSAAKILNAV
jgi:hypothetical protein